MNDPEQIQTDFRTAVGQALDVLARELQPFVANVLGRNLPPGISWTWLLRRNDETRGIRAKTYSESDLALMLRALNERLGDLGFPFDGRMSRDARNHARLLREVRNRWAHYEPFTRQQAYRAVDSVDVLLDEIGAVQALPQLQELMQRLLDTATATAAPASPAASESETTTAGIVEPQAAQPEAAQPGVSQTEVARTEVAELETVKPATDDVLDPNGSSALQLTIEVTALSRLSYAMAHIGIPVITEITVHNSGEPLSEATMEIELTSSTDSIRSTSVHVLDIGAEEPTRLRAPRLPIDPAKMYNVDDVNSGNLDGDYSRFARTSSWTERMRYRTASAVALDWVAHPIESGDFAGLRSAQLGCHSATAR